MKINNIFLFSLLLVLLSSCEEPKVVVFEDDIFIPLPREIVTDSSSFEISPNTVISFNESSLSAYALELNDILIEFVELDLEIEERAGVKRGHIHFSLDTMLSNQLEGAYELMISHDNVQILAGNKAGLYYGLKSLKQLLLYQSGRQSVEEEHFLLPAGRIIDEPQFEYRGMMLDISRHFFPADSIKLLMDWMSDYKMNVLHLHLSDDQGWRIHIDKWPELTATGAQTEVGGTPGGFLSKKDFVGLVQYAAAKHITIVPEIDMPGHTNAALASYAFLNCDNKKRDLYTGTRVGFSTFCTRKEAVYSFLDDVIGEIASLSPGPYFHIGGDESDVTSKEDYLYFLERVASIVASKDKVLMGWDDIAVGDLIEGSVMQVWHSKENAKLAVDKGMKLVLSPAEYAYLDMKYDKTTELGLDWASLIEVDRSYDWNPESYVSNVEDHILGLECPLWTETVEDMEDLEFLVFPRLLSYAELAWTKSDKRDWAKYRQRLASQQAYFLSNSINYYPSPKVDWKK